MNLKDISKSDRIELAQNTTPDSILRELARDISWEVRLEVADNPNTPEESLLMLSKDVNPEIRRNVALNCSTPKHILVALANEL